MSQIKFSASAINGVCVDCGNSEVAFDCGVNVASISPGYLIRKQCCGNPEVQCKISLAASNPADANDVSGTVITMVDGSNYFITGRTVDEVQAACNTCCGDVGTLEEVANGAFASPSASSAFCLTTTGDDGSLWFVQQLAERYYGRYDVTRGFSRFATNKFTFYTTDALASIVVATGHSVASGACA